jgi:hypothetical protein
MLLSSAICGEREAFFLGADFLAAAFLGAADFFDVLFFDADFLVADFFVAIFSSLLKPMRYLNHATGFFYSVFLICVSDNYQPSGAPPSKRTGNFNRIKEKSRPGGDGSY